MEYVLLVVGLVAGALIGWFAAKSRRAEPVVNGGPDPAVLVAQHEAALAEVRRQGAESRAAIEADLAAAQASVTGLQSALDTLRDDHRALIDQNRRDQAEREIEKANEAKVLQQLEPVAQQLKAMQEKVTEVETQRAQQHGELKEQILSTQRAAAESEKAAQHLTTVLKGSSQVRGRWGEMALRNLIESAGLLNRVDFEEQYISSNEDGQGIRPDLIVHLPGGKVLAVDSKVPLGRYDDALAEGISPEDQLRSLTEHASAIRAHVNKLSDKRYWTGLDGTTLDFTIAFIPADPILDAAFKADPSLMEYAFSKNVVLGTPASTWAILKGVAYTWRQEELTNDAKELFDLGKELYGRIVTMAGHVDAMGKTLSTTVGNYNKFVASLQRNVFTSAQRFDKLDESKVFPEVREIDAAPEPLTKGEFLVAIEGSDIVDAEIVA